MTYEEALHYFEQTEMMGSRLGLDRVAELLRRLGSPEKKLKFIHVAGTNGKGSTATLLASCLQCAGYQVGLYTSPHLNVYNERFRINGRMVGNQRLAEVTERVKEATDTMEDAPTQFELLTCVALCYFQEEQCDIVVLEVGLGGRLDATNVIPVPEASVITRIGLEHTEILGDTIEKIAAEKAGIVKPEGRVILGDPSPVVRAVTEEICRQRGAELFEMDPAEAKLISRSLEGQKFSWREYPEITLALLGGHQVYNSCTVLGTIEVLRARGWKLPESAVLEGFRTVVWPGRFECASKAPALIIDGGHNTQCAEAVAAALKEYFPGKKCKFLMGVLADKDFHGIFDALLPLAEKLAAVTPDSPRALAAPELCRKLKEEYGFTAAVPYENPADALAALRREAGPEDVICVCGSLYMIGEIRNILGLE